MYHYVFCHYVLLFLLPSVCMNNRNIFYLTDKEFFFFRQSRIPNCVGTKMVQRENILGKLRAIGLSYLTFLKCLPIL